MMVLIYIFITAFIAALIGTYYMPWREPQHGFRIHYKKGYKYWLTRDYSGPTDLSPDDPIETGWIDLDTNGWIVIREGYAWDGPSGPTIDTRDFMRGALVHDAMYQLIRMGRLPPSARVAADFEMKKTTREDGMGTLRNKATFAGVSLFASYAADPENKRKEFSAPT